MYLSQTFHLHLTAEERAQSPYRLLPFDIPDGIARLDIEYRIADPADPAQEGKASGSVVDLGLFDPRGHTFLDAGGFRGWSGSAREKVTLSATAATPGYLPGPLYPGTWHALLGLSEIAPQGCDVTVTISAAQGEAVGEAAPVFVPSGVLQSEARWYRGDLHCHTHHSDGTAPVADLVDAARAQGLDYLAVTEHNTVSHLPDLTRHACPDLLLIPGIEVTTHAGHANVWGVRSWQEFRARNGDEIHAVRERVRAQGLTFSINHPKDDGPPWAFERGVDPDAVEGWQAPWWLSNYQSLAFWERLLQQGKRPTLVGGSDKHQGPFDGTLSLYEVGTPTTWVYAPELSEQTILDGIRAGHVYVSQNPDGPRLSLTGQASGAPAMMGDAIRASRDQEITFRCEVRGADPGWLLRVVHRAGEVARVPIDGPEWSYTWRVAAQADDWYRIEVIDPPDAPLDSEPAALFAYALSNPIYVTTEED